MPSFPIVDTHLHLWDVGRLRYPWLRSVPALNRNHLMTEYDRACGPVQVAKMVFVQCECDPAQGAEEAQWVSALAVNEPRIRGIVAHAPLEKGERAGEQVARLAELPLVRGVRRLIQGEADPEFCLRPDFVRGVQLLQGFGLSFDLCIKHPQLAATIKLVKQCPDVKFVIDHIGKPDIKAGRLDPWRAELRELAQLGNVWCKLSGLATEADVAAWRVADLRPYIEHVLACFGFDRVMFGGDWPVSTLATDYPRWVETVDEVLQGTPASDLRRLYVTNAEAFYRI